MKLLLGNVEALFLALPQRPRVAYWDTLRRTSYPSGIPITSYTIRVMGLINLLLLDRWTLAEVTIECGSHSGEAHDQMDKAGKEKVTQYRNDVQEEIKTLAKNHAVELRDGILTTDPKEHLLGIVKEEKEVQQ